MQDNNNKPAASPWRPIKTAPRDGTKVLLRGRWGLIQVCMFCRDDGIWGERWAICGGRDSAWRFHDIPVAWAKIYNYD